jgi:hypothetical protein
MALVYESESGTNQRNQAIGALMLAYGYIHDNWQQAVDLYTRRCSIGVHPRDLGVMAATLAFGGRNPVAGTQVISVPACRRGPAGRGRLPAAAIPRGSGEAAQPSVRWQFSTAHRIDYHQRLCPDMRG